MIFSFRYLSIALLLSLSGQVLAHGKAASSGEQNDPRQIQFPDTDEYLTLTVDLHTHSVFSDGHVWPSIRVGEANKDGLDALAITEHLEWQPHRADIPHPDRNRAYNDALTAIGNSELLLIAGSEITRNAPAGHINAVFTTDVNKLIQAEDPPADPADTVAYYTHAGQWPAQSAVEAANDQGAFVFWNHPYWTSQNPDGIARIPPFHSKNARKGLLHGIEIANGNSYSEEAFAIARKYNLAVIGVSDVHNLIDWDYKPHEGGHRPVTLDFTKERTLEGIKEALFDRRTVVWFKNTLIGEKRNLIPLLEASLTATDGKYLPDTDIVRVTLENRSDSDLQLMNKSKYTFMEVGDLLEVPAHGSLVITVKPGKRVKTLNLAFDVLNALIAPKKNASMSFRVSVKEPQKENTPTS